MYSIVAVKKTNQLVKGVRRQLVSQNIFGPIFFDWAIKMQQ
jgi:hypothetical protein